MELLDRLSGCAALGVIHRVWEDGPCPGCHVPGEPLRVLIDGTEDWSPAARQDVTRLVKMTVGDLIHTDWYRRTAARNAHAGEAERERIRRQVRETND